MSLLKPRDYYKPFAYPWAYDAYRIMQSLHWLPHEAPMDTDIQDWNEKLKPSEKNQLTQLFRFFTQADVDVARGYFEKYGPRFPHPEVRMMLASFMAAEANHIDAYATLIDTLGLPEVEFRAFLDYQAMREKHEYMFERESGTSIADLIVDIAVFSAFGEGMQLFSSFALLMNYQRRGLMKGMTTIVEWSIRDETHHVESMIKLLHELIKEHPRAWNDETKKRIYDAGRRMVDLEDAFIDQAFALGEVDGVTPEDTKKYIRYIADRRWLQLGMKPNYGQKENPFDWLDWIMNAPTHANFFEQRSTEYGKGEVAGWPTAFAFLQRPMWTPYAAGGCTDEGVCELPEPLRYWSVTRPAVSPVKTYDPDVTVYRVYTKKDCPHCDRAKAYLDDLGIPYEAVQPSDVGRRAKFEEVRNHWGHPAWNSSPMVFLLDADDGSEEAFIGGADDLADHLDIPR
ncbi:putative ribonucleoside diphosphate reductase beta subunit [Caulobacter phage CcrRogue]|uniref:ribonucleoside-diphosphate reductase n=1 Tax=Caulobacter phage CcrRogue TaxID=2927986 RepID=K4JQM6_9CAUD|nr:putative ribonucleoside diphosphate reductase beta subunit [Caulobacter phage CcrRogue]AFU86590.1 putative ribonucleoside diphosphate reductase beta subunit [Caulobacter phage CcrRogue]